ncbi:MAG: hypothetical protein M3R47_03015 [Chloroflexota bacterium]|nr:hypothetical protein [Chloroflexota bacterium]
MAPNTNPIFPLTPVIGLGQVSAANTNRDGTGTLVSILTGATNGTRVHRITVYATVTTTGGMVRLFIDGGGVIRLWREVAILAVTVSATVKGHVEIITLSGEDALHLPSGYILKASTHNAEAINVITEGGNY